MSEQIKLLVDSLGERFIRYVLGITSDVPELSELSEAQIQAVTTLFTLVSQIAISAPDPLNAVMNVSNQLMTYQESLGATLAGYLRTTCGGELEAVPYDEDPVLYSLRVIARDVWPTYLLKAPSEAPRTFWLAASAGVHSHVGLVDACRALLSDPCLASLFPEATPLKDGASMTDVVGISSNWIVSGGSGGTRQITSILGAVLFDAAIRAQVGGGVLDQDAMMRSLAGSLSQLRRFAEKKTIEVPAFVGFDGARVASGRVLVRDGTLRELSRLEGELLLNEVDRISAVFETTFPIRLLAVEPIQKEPDDGSFIRLWKKYTPQIEETHRTFQRKIDQVRLALLLSSKGADELLAVAEVSRYIADFSQPGGAASWNSSQNPVARFELSEDQIVDVTRWHELVQTKHPESLNVAMKRLLSAVSQRLDATDAFIDALIVWENAFGTRAETKFRVTGSIAALLETGDTAKRVELQKELGTLYDARSRLVHGSKEPEAAQIWNYRQRAILIAMDVLRRLYSERADLLQLDSEARSRQLLLEV